MSIGIPLLGLLLGGTAIARTTSEPVDSNATEVASAEAGRWPTLHLEPVERFRRSIENLRFTIDLSERVSWSADRQELASQAAIGLDLHKVFSGDHGDWGTAVLQGYLTRIDNQPVHPPFFEDSHDWEFVHRIFNLNYTGLAGARLNLRLGHFEIPYGLEHVINTNGTLRDYTHGSNLGIKADWGVAANGVFPSFEYEVGITRGIADEHHGGRPRIVAGRIGTASEKNTVIGLSGFYGRISNEAAVDLWKRGLRDPSRAARVRHILRRARVGLDTQWHMGRYGVLGEVSYGRDYDQEVLNGLIELDWVDAAETWTTYLQVRFSNRDWEAGWEDEWGATVGLRFAPDRHWAMSTQWTQDFTRFGGADRDSVVSIQVRYRY